ncbi:hypothetical protein K9M42_02215 [Patescibacteria group bacterium]|nr:hypothetical protein [Patescibacteria group bacterium]
MSKNNSKLVLLIFFVVFVFSVFLIIFTFNKNVKFISSVDEESDFDSFMNMIYEDEDFLAYLERKKEDDSYYVDDKLVDTDGDGLSDFDEENIFFTSKYLVDSDGDGVSDFLEIKTGTDPNCLTGSSCNDNNIEIAENELDYSVSQVRTFLNKAVGSDYSVIFDSLTDEQLMNLFNNSYFKTQEVFSSISGSLENLDVDNFLNDNNINDDNISEKENLENDVNDSSSNKDLFLEAISDLDIQEIQAISDMEISEIRSLFVDSGIFTEDFMNSLSDSEIIELLNVL